MDKYRMTNESMEHNGRILWRIECLKTRKKGGWIQSEMNLSQFGESWVADNAKVYGEASVLDNAKVSENAEVSGAAKITADALVYGNATVSDYALVTAYAKIYDNASIEDSAQVYGNASVSGNAVISAYAQIYDYATIEGFAQVYDNVQIYGHATIKDRAYIYKDAHIRGYTVVSNNDRVGKNLYNWEDINALTQLQITTEKGEKTAALFANGKHQIAIKVRLEARDRMDQLIEVSAKELFDHLEFVDEQNNPIQKDIKYSDQPGLYVYPPTKEANQMQSTGESSALFYFSITQVLKPFRLCVRGKIKQWSKYNGLEKTKRVEYTTSLEHNNGELLADYISFYVVPKRQFVQTNIDVQTVTETDVNGVVNSKLTQYYVQFNSEDGIAIRHASCIERKWFHYKQTGIYKRCCISTDASFVADENALFTFKFEFTSSKFKKVVTKNHQADGLCFWVYQLWEGLLWSYYEWGGEMYFSLFDQYGNEANIIAKSSEEDQLNFCVRLVELNRE
ncbi:transferase [Myroides odoratus]|uniref:transferase n=1 Tax=Myroides odoratus TaxID=256 RepID=UPI0039AF44DC